MASAIGKRTVRSDKTRAKVVKAMEVIGKVEGLHFQKERSSRFLEIAFEEAKNQNKKVWKNGIKTYSGGPQSLDRILYGNNDTSSRGEDVYRTNVSCWVCDIFDIGAAHVFSDDYRASRQGDSIQVLERPVEHVEHNGSNGSVPHLTEYLAMAYVEKDWGKIATLVVKLEAKGL